ncbi:MAG: endonuclease MutS2, partial [Bacteroidota bacterium]
MHLEPGDLYEKLEFDKVIDLLVKECLGELGAEQLRKLTLETSRLIIIRKLKEVKSYKLTITESDNFPLQPYQDLSKDLRMLEVIDFVLPIDGLQRINQVMRIVKGILKFFTTARKEVYPDLFQIVRDIHLDESLMAAIDKVIDEEGNIRPNASPDLLVIDRKIKSKTQELDKVFRGLIGKYRKNGWLTENVESFRNGRRVLSVPAEHKRKIRGIIHDESASGKTAFIEPEAIIQINNDIFDLENEYKREVYRILKALSTTLRPYGHQFKIYQDLIVYLDVVRSKAELAVRMNANMPQVKEGAFLGYKEAYHPLLYLKNKQIDKPTVPFDLVLKGANRILVLSGPNAGGKSISMKTAGLCQLMLQAGMLIPVNELSEVGIFEKIFADIGDQQSLEDDLSTYSSRLQNMRIFLQNADEKTLLLIDEFGSGTDPKIGGAIA